MCPKSDHVRLHVLSCVQLFATPWTVAHQAPLFMEFSRQKCRSGLSFPSSGDLSYLGIEPQSPELQADSLLSEPPGMTQNIKHDINNTALGV